MKSFRSLKNRVLIISSVFLILMIGISFTLYSFNEIHYEECGIEIPEGFCATESPNLSDLAKKGKQIFNTDCAACHKLDRKMTGPSLRNIFNNQDYPYDDYVFDFITKEDSLLNINDKYTKAINEEYLNDFTHKFNLSASDLECLMEYIKG